MVALALPPFSFCPFHELELETDATPLLKLGYEVLGWIAQNADAHAQTATTYADNLLPELEAYTRLVSTKRHTSPPRSQSHDDPPPCSLFSFGESSLSRHHGVRRPQGAASARWNTALALAWPSFAATHATHGFM